jgi:hypothetical protein
MKKDRRVTITILNGVSDSVAFERLAKVAQEGKISRANEKDHYTFLTTWSDGIYIKTRTKYKTDSDRFIVGRDSRYISMNCPECEKKLVLTDGQKNLFSCSCGAYKLEKDYFIKLEKIK